MSTRTVTGDCLVRFDGPCSRRLRGQILAIVKPDNTVLVHDDTGYQPVAWLTRPERLSITEDPLWILAEDGTQTLRIEAVGTVRIDEHQTSVVGDPIGECPCGGTLIRSRNEICCPDCSAQYGLPSGAEVVDETCSCGLPKMSVRRGREFNLCIDRQCESLDDAVIEAYDREWDCPTCGSEMQILRRGGLLAGCVQYPDCETGYAIPDGIITATCTCGLPIFKTSSGERCLDQSCAINKPE